MALHVQVDADLRQRHVLAVAARRNDLVLRAQEKKKPKTGADGWEQRRGNKIERVAAFFLSLTSAKIMSKARDVTLSSVTATPMCASEMT